MLKKINIMLVDDEEVFLESMKKRLEMRGFEVIPASNGETALEAADAHDFDIALVDLKMPGMSGEEVLSELKKKHPLLEVIILTGHGSIESAVECTQEGAYKYLQKPYEFDKLIETLIEAYKSRLINKTMIEREKIEAGLKTAVTPLDILRRLREFDQEK